MVFKDLSFYTNAYFGDSDKKIALHFCKNLKTSGDSDDSEKLITIMMMAMMKKHDHKNNDIVDDDEDDDNNKMVVMMMMMMVSRWEDCSDHEISSAYLHNEKWI